MERKKRQTDSDDMRPEYDFDYSKAVRGKYYRRIMEEGMTFPLDDPAVRAALRRHRQGRRRLTAAIRPEGGGFVSHCPELDIASQGATFDEAHTNLLEALELFLETASPTELAALFRDDTGSPGD